MTYLQRINSLTERVSPELVDFSIPRERATAPTQASSNFITNKEQGDWAENLLLTAINKNSCNLVAVHYGKNDDIVAGDVGFDDFYESFQDELDTIGKRPDLLIFKKEDYIAKFGLDISTLPHGVIDEYVKKAIAGIEVRSSAFLIDKYEEEMARRTETYIGRAIELKNEILTNYESVLRSNPSRSRYIGILDTINRETIHAVSFRTPGWSSSKELVAVNEKFKELKTCIKEIQKRDYLSITPKVEDLKVVRKWIETFKVPHYYFQVFFDKIYGISFEHILEIISNPENEGIIFWVEKDAKNQNKTTIKIKSREGIEIANRIDEPNHFSVRKEMGRGRLLFYVSFDGGTAYLNATNFMDILNVKSPEF